MIIHFKLKIAINPEALGTPPPRGLGTTIGKLQIWVRAELPERLPMLRDSKLGVLNEHGANQYETGLCNTKSNSADSDYIISRLKRDNPELAQKVIYGEISANQAAASVPPST